MEEIQCTQNEALRITLMWASGYGKLTVDLLYDKIPLIITAGSVYLCGVCRHVVLLGLPVRLTWYPM